LTNGNNVLDYTQEGRTEIIIKGELCMKFKIPVDELQGIINLLGITAKVNTKEVAGRVLIEAKNNSVFFLSNNLSTGISITTTKVEVEEEGSASVVFGKIKSFVSPFTLWDEDKGEGAKHFNFKGDERHIILTVRNKYSNGKVSNGRVKLDSFNSASILRPTDFTNPTFSLSANAFKAAIGKVLYAVDANCMAPALRGMCIRFTEDRIYFVGTNGAVLSEYAIDNICDLKEGSFVVKLDFMMGLRRLIVPDMELSFEFTDKDVKVKSGDIMFWGKLLIGTQYPEYSHMFEDFDYEITIDKMILMSNLVPLMDVLDPSDSNRIVFKIEDKKISLYNDVGSFICDCDFSFPREIIATLDGTSMFKTIDSIQDENIVIKFSEDTLKSFIFDSDTYHDQKSIVSPLKTRH